MLQQTQSLQIQFARENNAPLDNSINQSVLYIPCNFLDIIAQEKQQTINWLGILSWCHVLWTFFVISPLDWKDVTHQIRIIIIVKSCNSILLTDDYPKFLCNLAENIRHHFFSLSSFLFFVIILSSECMQITANYFKGFWK